ncbi:MAG: hypothetical protein NVSMB18_27300 [Acetobacteraceae bacterium]
MGGAASPNWHEVQVLANEAAVPPFRLQSVPGEAYPHPSWVRARAEALAALERGQSAAVLGRAGSGKSLLLQDVAHELRRQGRVVATIGRAEALTGPIAGDVVVVDEAGLMPVEALRALCSEGRPVLLAALPDFASSLALLPGPVVQVTLERLAAEEVARFVVGRLDAAGRRRDLFEPAAILALALHSGGVPRLVNVLAGSALFLAEQEETGQEEAGQEEAGQDEAGHKGVGRAGSVTVTRRHVEEAAAIRAVLVEEAAGQPVPALEARVLPPPLPDPPAPVSEPETLLVRPPPARRRRVALVVVAGALGLAVLGSLFAPRTRPPPTALNVAVQVPVAPPAPRPPSVAVPPQGAAGPAAPPVVAPAPPPSPPASTPMPGPPLPAGGVGLSFHGPVTNETMHQSGQLAVTVRRAGSSDAVMIQFHAYAGLVGSGELAGTIGSDGRIVASGRLMMGSNPFDCTLKATLAGDTLSGGATFTRASTGATAVSSFTLTRRS